MTQSLDYGNVNRNRYMDAAFKRFVSNKYILSAMLKGCVREFRDSDIEEIIGCLDVDEGTDRVRRNSNEYDSENGGRIIMDSVFEVRLPNGSERVGVIVNLEGQTLDHKDLGARAMYYGSSLIAQQKGRSFRNMDYGSLRKVYSIWCILRPQSDRKDTIASYSMQGRYLGGFEGRSPLNDCDFLEIVMIGLGNAEKGPSPASDDPIAKTKRMLEVFFDNRLSDREKTDEIEQLYNIPYNDGLNQSLEDIRQMLSYDEWVQAEIEEQKKETRCETIAEMIRGYMAKMNVSLEQALEDHGLSEEEREIVIGIIRGSE